MNKQLNKTDLAWFTGSENWYRHSLVRTVLYTDGVKHVAEQGGAYWLIDEIALAQATIRKVAVEEFQIWKLKVNADQTAKLTCDDGKGNILLKKRIEFTDFPLDEIKIYYTNRTIFLPSEY